MNSPNGHHPIRGHNTMKYTDYLQSQPKDFCPFCDAQHDRIFLDNEYALLTFAKAPYHPHHLLVVPREHKKSFLELTKEASDAIWALIRQGSAVLLELGYESYTVIVREGKNGAKSIEHLHYHIIPENHIGDLDHDGNTRDIMTESESEKISDEIMQAVGRMTFRGLL